MRYLKNYKSSLLIFTLILLFAACKTKNTTETRDIQLLTDTSAYMNNLYSDTAVTVQEEVINRSEKAPVSSGNSVKHSTSGSKGQTTTTSTSSTSTNNGNSSSTSTGSGNKGWSKAAKGAVIGGAAGAVGGAVITKKGSGAAIGAAVGAASGYIIGKDQDKQDGRVRRKKQ